MSIRHLLLDADDVLQVGARHFLPELGEAFGEDPTGWLRETFRPDGSVLDGRSPVVPLLERRLRDLGRDVDAEQLYDRLWLVVEPDPGMLAQVARWRGSGLTVHLATNQDSGRAAYMQQLGAYAATLDGGYYSCDLGVAKPAAGFFEAILADLGAEPDTVCFVDDLADNVAGAQRVGIRAVRWELAEGLDVLGQRLAGVGLAG